MVNWLFLSALLSASVAEMYNLLIFLFFVFEFFTFGCLSISNKPYTFINVTSHPRASVLVCILEYLVKSLYKLN